MDGLGALIGMDLGEQRCAYDERDVMLYALAVGAGPSELALVYERDLRVLPTFAVTLGLWAVWAVGSMGAYDPNSTLHASQKLLIKKCLPVRADFTSHGRVSNVWDKGSAALVEIEVSSEYFDATYTIFVPGGGGFNGERGTSASRQAPEGDGYEATLATTPTQALLYRLTGDRHPVHVDPEAARGAGLQGPILHGMCLLGAVMLTAARTIGRDPTQLLSVDARMTAVVYPGAACKVLVWPQGSAFHYRASVDDVAVISGWARFDEPLTEARILSA